MRLLADVRPLRESPEFRRLWAGMGLSSVGSRMTGFMLILQVYQRTDSSAMVGVLSLIQGTAMLVTGLFGGSLVDALDRRRLVLVTSAALASVSAALAGLALLTERQLWPLLTLAALQAMPQGVDGPARRVFVPRLLPTARVAAGLALFQFPAHVSRLAGPVLAGVLAAGVGAPVCYLIDSVSFVAALYGVGRLPAMPPEGPPARPRLRDTVDGLRFIRRQPLLVGIFLADLDAMILGMPIAVFPALNAAHFGGSAGVLGLLTGAPAIGGLLGAMLSGPVAQARRPGRMMLAAVAVWGGAVAAFGVASLLWLALPLLVVAGAADSASVVLRATIVQLMVPDRLRGRVTSVDFLVGFVGPDLGNFEAGALASLTSPVISAVSGGLATVVGVGLLGAGMPALASFELRRPQDGAADVALA